MKTQSTIEPNQFYIKDNKIIFITNLETLTKTEIIDNEEIQTTIYQYDELPLELTPRKNMQEYVETKFNILFKYAKDNQCGKMLMNELKMNNF